MFRRTLALGKLDGLGINQGGANVSDKGSHYGTRQTYHHGYIRDGTGNKCHKDENGSHHGEMILGYEAHCKVSSNRLHLRFVAS